MSEYLRLNIAIIPPEEVAIAAIKLSQELSKLGKASFILDGRDFHPHVTCYSPEFPVKNLDKIVARLETLAKEYRAFENKLEGFVPTPEDPGTVEVKLKKSKEIDELHRKIIKELNPLREGHLREKYRRPDFPLKFPEDRRELMTKIMKEVGYPRVLDAYGPHISIIRFENPEIAEEAIEKTEWKINSMRVEKIGIFTMGDYGTCKKLLNEFSLLR
ncbi:2'-5' RNA ligase family protein [Patescibacteria group bacterium]|nr:2'-5' RNA ligase family protein [Patescibacteria group bacterium]